MTESGIRMFPTHTLVLGCWLSNTIYQNVDRRALAGKRPFPEWKDVQVSVGNNDGTVSAKGEENREEASNHWDRKVSYGKKKEGNKHICNRRRETCTIWYCEKNTERHLLPQSVSFSPFFASTFLFTSFLQNILCVCVHPASFYSFCQVPIRCIQIHTLEGVPSTPVDRDNENNLLRYRESSLTFRLFVFYFFVLTQHGLNLFADIDPR